MADPHQRLQSLDGLRAVSILLVVFSHGGLGHIVPGGLGVTIFFFISGYIISCLLLNEYSRTNEVSISNFYIRRFLRLMPALLVYLLLTLLLMTLVGQQIKVIDFASVLLYFSNYHHIFSGFAQETITSPLRITWSLAIEEHYYFFYPAIFAALVARRNRFLALVGVGIGAVLLWRIYLVKTLGMDEFTLARIYMGTDTRVDGILYGACFALLTAYFPASARWLKRPGALWLGALILLLTLLVRDEIFRETVRYSLQGIALMLMFDQLLFGNGWIKRSLETPIMSYLGRISYSLYLYHWMVLAVVTKAMPEYPMTVKLVAFLPASLLLAHFSYRYVERPFLNLSRKIMTQRRQPGVLLETQKGGVL